MYKYFFWALFAISAIFAIVDCAKARPDKDWKQNTLWNLGEILTMLVISIITAVFAFFAHNYGLESKNVATIISLAFITMPIRKVVDILVLNIASYLCITDNAVNAAFFQRIIIVDPRTREENFSVGILLIYHFAVYLLSLLLYFVCAAFPAIPMSRINVLVNFWTNVIAKFTDGNSFNMVIIMIWFLTLVVFLGLIATYLVSLYKNFIFWCHNNNHKIKDIHRIRYLIVLLFFVRKFFIYAFIMDAYRLYDFIFWWFICIGILIISFVVWYLRRRRGFTSSNIW